MNFIIFKKRSDLHIARKIWHVVTVFSMALCYYYLPSFWSASLLLAAWLIFVPLDFIRKKLPQLNELSLQIFGPIVRENEVKGVAGTTYLLTGVLIVYFIFPRDIVLLTLLYLAFADPIASYVGIKYGKDKLFKNKSLQGSAAAFFVCIILTYLFLQSKAIAMDRLIVMSILGGLIGSAAEAIPIGNLDDNFSIPVFSAIGLWILFYVFGGIA